MRLSIVVAQSVALLGFMCLGRPLLAQASPIDQEAIARIGWTPGPALGRLRDVAQVMVPELCRFADADGARQFLAAVREPSLGRAAGVLLCHSAPDIEDAWFVLFTYNDVGRINDDEKSSLDTASLLVGLRRANDEVNELRRREHGSGVDIVGWQRPPVYNVVTHGLMWATRLHEQNTSEDESVSHAVRILGRDGDMNIDFAIDAEHAEAAEAVFAEIVNGFSFLPGHRYSDWRAGDRVSEHGLTALVVGAKGRGHDRPWQSMPAVLAIAKRRLALIVGTALIAFLIWMVAKAARESAGPSRSGAR